MTPVCATCGAWFPEASSSPQHCPICDDERQYVPDDGQRWTTPEELAEGRSADVRPLEPGLSGVGLDPPFAIGQRLLLVETPEGNVVWDMVPLVTDEGVQAILDRGPVRAIAVSHPHYYSAMGAWSDALGGVPILLHAADREHVTRPHPAIEHWDGDTTELPGGLTLLRLGGHFEGGTVLHWPAGADGRGVILSGDIVMVVPDRRFVSFMWSYPNLVPLPAREVARMAAALEPWEFDRMYGAWWTHVIRTGAQDAVRRGAERYVRALA